MSTGPVKICFPQSVVPCQEDFRDALKLYLACKLAKRDIVISHDVHLAPGGRLPCLMMEDTQIFDVNAAVRYILSAGTSFGADEKLRAQINRWFEWESLSFDPRVLEKSLSSPVDRPFLDHPAIQAVLLPSALYPSQSAADSASSEVVRKWIEDSLKSEAFRNASVEDAKALVTAKDTVKVDQSAIVKDLKQKIPVLPVEGERNVLITSALPYVNNVPHLGNIIGCVLSADVYARYCRLKGYNTLYICGTDEYGTATETKALEEGLSCQEICDKYHKIHAEVYKWFDIDFDYFGRTSTPIHTEISQNIFLRLNSKGLLEKKSVQQLYSDPLKKFLADRFVIGTCPFCGYDDARGDQCDKCGKTYDAIQLVQPRCKMSGSTPIVKSSEHMFLDLSGLQPKCEQWVKEASVKGFWSQNGIGITQGWFKMGLEPRCITRDLKWGTPVPVDDMSDKVFYVWFDAPIGYLSITANYTAQWEKWWKNPKQVELFQFMGKDNVPFHTVVFPCTLLGTEEDYTLLHHLSTTEYLNYEGDKFSKSRNVGVFGHNVMETGIPVSVWRYYLLSNRPENNDSMFVWSDLAVRNNTELVANFGNFINRALKYLKAKFNSVLPPVKLEPEDLTAIAKINALIADYTSNMEQVRLRNALQTIMLLSTEGNTYLQNNKLDNTLFEKNPKRCGAVINVACNIIYTLASLIHPFMPSTSDSILTQLNAPLGKIPEKFNLSLLEGHRIGNPDHLFQRMEEKQMQELFMKYGGVAILEKRKKAAEEEEAKKKAAKSAAGQKKKPVGETDGKAAKK